MAPLKRILVADGHPLIRRGLRTLIETRPDLEVIAEAATAGEALEAARRSQPDIAIIDYVLCERDGYLPCLQLMKAAPRVHVLVYTTLDDDRTIREALEAGASGFIRKADTETDLFAAIDAVAQGNFYFSAAITSTLHAGGGGSFRPGTHQA